MPEIAAHVEAGIVDQHVEATVCRVHDAEHGGHVLAARHVGGDGLSRRACSHDLPGRGLGGGSVDVGDVDVCSLGREQHCDRPADARAGARHEGDLAVERAHEG